MDQNVPPAQSEPDLWGSGYDSTQQKSFFANLRGHFIDFIQTFVVFAAIFALIYLFIAQPHKVSGLSMYPTFHDADYILTDKLSYRFGTPKHGDVIVLKNPQDEAQDFIKRIIALPGDTVTVQNNMVLVNNQPINEYYLPPNTQTHAGAYLTEGTQVTAGSGQFYVMGDNRGHSSDSREWGPVPKKDIIGKVFLKYWPPESFGLFKPLP
ncbi:MAG: signal peptidase I [Candidatus Daviesbacteria bacterium]|nr:signal peptidase I [Candidatus Daviesbacteria bacterium]